MKSRSGSTQKLLDKLLAEDYRGAVRSCLTSHEGVRVLQHPGAFPFVLPHLFCRSMSSLHRDLPLNASDVLNGPGRPAKPKWIYPKFLFLRPGRAGLPPPSAHIEDSGSTTKASHNLN